MKTDVVVVGGGLSGLAAAAELGDRCKQVVIVDQEGPQNLGGQAFWSLGGLFMIDTPEQRLMGIKDSHELALNDWMGSAQFDRPEDDYPRQWASAYLDFAAGEMRPWLHKMGLRWFPVVGWAERGGSDATGHGNSVPRFHITWGTGPGVLAHFIRRCNEHAAAGRLTYLHRHQVDRLEMQNGAAVGVSGTTLAPDDAVQGAQTNRTSTGEFRVDADAVIVASGGIGGNFELIRKVWPTERLGPAPKNMLSGVPAHVDGRMIGIAEDAGGHVINRDRLWFYTEGVKNWDPIWPAHGIRILPGPSSMWFDARGNRFAPPAMPGFDTNGTFKAILDTGYDYSWFVLTQKVIKKEFALSGSEQNPDLTSAKWGEVFKQRILSGKSATGPVEAFKEHGADFVVADNLSDLVKGMNGLTDDALIDETHLHRQIEARDAQVDNPFSKDPQITAIQAARHYRGDKLIRTAKPHRFLDPNNGPLIAVRLNLITRKTLGGLKTHLDSQMLDATNTPIAGLYAAGEAAGFGGGGYHGYNSLEGTFLGGCIFSGRAAGRNAG
ncbi:FAD-binding dehydrogenase [Yoonia sp. I 8.24]|uniref:FAD-binding dehydrogenase n=1 Tax=Yoonia sp. I 8.24 TaxID=1537229 RepID=UPI001EDCA2A6|nr:FAD-binding dehydrogenase [Yoonia sp. I 8.24]MCG3268817.1 FAD-binding dehydrogenase [Yoonia sp. I 8.24]